MSIWMPPVAVLWVLLVLVVWLVAWESTRAAHHVPLVQQTEAVFSHFVPPECRFD